MIEDFSERFRVFQRDSFNFRGVLRGVRRFSGAFYGVSRVSEIS